MRKILTLFVRDWDHNPRYVTPSVTPGCEWVINGEGIPTRKYDGTCVMFDGTRWWARREVKPDTLPPPGFVQVERDEETGKMVGWEPVEQSAFARWHSDALGNDPWLDHREVWDGAWPRGTYELIGPKVNGWQERDIALGHMLVLHADAEVLAAAPRDFEELAAWLHTHPYEGIVWHHPDGRMAKIKRRDFPAPLPVSGATR